MDFREGEGAVLRKEVKELLRPWVSSRTSPPWSDAELSTMCLIVRGPVSLFELRRWLKSNFAWCVKDKRLLNIIRSVRATSAMQGLAPIHCVSTGWRYGLAVEAPVHQIRLFLHKLLHSSNDSTSASKQDLISAIPTELRVMILNLVLAVPNSEVVMQLETNLSGSVVKVRDREVQGHPSRNALPLGGEFSHPGTHLTRPAAVVLAPLTVSKKFYEESISIFYGKNIFVYPDMLKLSRFLKHTPPARRDCIKHLVINYRPMQKEAKHARKWFKVMQTMKSLKTLDIQLDESFSYYDSYRSGNSNHLGTLLKKNPLVLPGISELASIRIKEVNVHGDCPTYRTHLAQMMLPKAIEEAKELPRKRKAVSASSKVDQKHKSLKRGP